jgi:hypothetical protein
MKKFTIITLVVVLVGAISIGVLAYGPRGGKSDNVPQQGNMYGPRGGMMDDQSNQMYGPRGRMMYNTPQNQPNQMYGPRGKMYNTPQNQQMPMYGGRGGMMHGGRGGMNAPRQQYKNNAPCCEACPYYDGSTQNAPVQPGQRPQTSQMITEDKVKEVAEAFVAKNFPEYSVAEIEKDDWRPLYFVTIKGANDAEQVMTIHGFNGQVMNIFPKTTDDAE